MGYDTSGAGGVIYVCPHTGESFMGSDLASARALALACSPNCDGALESGNISVLTGKPSDQTGSQFWMDANPQGEALDVSDAVKAVCSDANYAAGWAAADMASLKAAGVGINANMEQVIRYPTSVGTAEIWQALPQLKPVDPATKNPVAYNTPVNSPGSTSEPGFVTSNNLVTSGPVLGDQNMAGAGSTGIGAVSTAANALKSLPLAAIGAVLLVIVVIVMLAKGTGRAAI